MRWHYFTPEKNVDLFFTRATMTKHILYISALLIGQQLPAQNLVVNGDAESLPRGTGWTVVSEGAITCLLVPTNNMVNWTMKPNGWPNYPFDHTTGAAGGTVFFAGCDTYFTGPFETRQDIDLSADAALIDAGGQLYDFSGYIQTPVEPQTDQGRFIVEYKNAANTVLATYNSSWQSNFYGSGIDWVHHTNSRTAPVGTRKVTIRLQSELHINQPAINAYFDDVSFSKTSVVPLGLLSFDGTETGGNVYLSWKLSGQKTFKQFDVERSTQARYYEPIASLQVGNTNNYYYQDKNIAAADKYFYRLKLTGRDGTIEYSDVVMVKIAGAVSLNISPNPANNKLTITGISQPGTISLISSNGATVLVKNTCSTTANFDVSYLPEGLYVVRFNNAHTTINKKLLIQHR